MTEDMHEERLQAVEAFSDSFVSIYNLSYMLFISHLLLHVTWVIEKINTLMTEGEFYEFKFYNFSGVFK